MPALVCAVINFRGQSKVLNEVHFNNNNNNILFICHIAELTELKGYKLQLKLLLL